jgi:long-chain acyl-CoA synthetase
MRHPEPSIAESPTPLTALLDRAARTPEATAIVIGGEKWSCIRLARQSLCLAEAMKVRGIRSGDRVALHMYNRSELVLAYLACWSIGAIAVPLNTRYKAPEIAAMVDRIRPALYLGEAELYGGIRDLAANLLAPEARFVIGFDASDIGARPWTALAMPEIAPADTVPLDNAAATVLFATSGTTGQSKIVVWTQRMLACYADNVKALGLSGDDVFLVVTPLVHAAGVSFLARCFLTGAVAVLLSQFDPNAVLDSIETHRCTAFTGAPFMYAQICRSQRERSRDLDSLHLCIVGGDICPGVIAREFETVTGKALHASWGATEDGGSMGPGVKPSPFMRELADVELLILDDEGRPVPQGKSGEMVIRSPRTAPGYWKGPDEIDFLPDGWFQTGDLVRRDIDGDLFFMGRKKDLIIRGGSNISPVEVETALRNYPEVCDAAVAGFPDPELGQRVGAVIVLTENATAPAVLNMIADLRRELADYKIPERVIVVETIPRNALAKVDRHAVAKIIADGTAV